MFISPLDVLTSLYHNMRTGYLIYQYEGLLRGRNMKIKAGKIKGEIIDIEAAIAMVFLPDK